MTNNYQVTYLYLVGAELGLSARNGCREDTLENAHLPAGAKGEELRTAGIPSVPWAMLPGAAIRMATLILPHTQPFPACGSKHCWLRAPAQDCSNPDTLSLWAGRLSGLQGAPAPGADWHGAPPLTTRAASWEKWMNLKVCKAVSARRATV